MTNEQLVRARLDLGLSQIQLARYLDVPRLRVAGWEAGYSPVPDAVELAMAKLVGVRQPPIVAIAERAMQEIELR